MKCSQDLSLKLDEMVVYFFISAFFIMIVIPDVLAAHIIILHPQWSPLNFITSYLKIHCRKRQIRIAVPSRINAVISAARRDEQTGLRIMFGKGVASSKSSFRLPYMVMGSFAAGIGNYAAPNAI